MSETIISKRCPKCKQIKLASEFHKNISRKDNLSGWCKLCNHTNDKKYSQTEKGKLVSRQRNRKYRNSKRGKIYFKEYWQSEDGKSSRKRYYIKNPKKIQGRSAIANAIRYGKLPRPDSLQCYYCPNQAKEYHHYLGYAPKHWLDVIPICIPCHIH